jgi:hypothetical protein
VKRWLHYTFGFVTDTPCWGEGFVQVGEAPYVGVVHSSGSELLCKVC